MKTLFILLMLVFTACGQYQQDTMQVDISFPAFPQEVIDNINHYRWFIELKPLGQQMELFSGMPLADALASADITNDGLVSFPFNAYFLANGDQFNVAVFGLDAVGNELSYMLDEFNRYNVKCGVAGGTLPQIADIIDHDVYIQVNVGF